MIANIRDCAACGEDHVDMTVQPPPSDSPLYLAKGRYNKAIFEYECPVRKAIAVVPLAKKELRG